MQAELSQCCNQVHTVDSEFCMSGNDPSTIKNMLDLLSGRSQGMTLSGGALVSNKIPVLGPQPHRRNN